MCINDRCRFCEGNLRIKGTLTHSKKIFDKRSKEESVCSLLSQLGLVLANTPLRSNRLCVKCFRLILRLKHDMNTLNNWRKKEQTQVETSAISGVDKGGREPTPSKTPKEMPQLSVQEPISRFRQTDPPGTCTVGITDTQLGEVSTSEVESRWPKRARLEEQSTDSTFYDSTCDTLYTKVKEEPEEPEELQHSHWMEPVDYLYDDSLTAKKESEDHQHRNNEGLSEGDQPETFLVTVKEEEIEEDC